MGRKVYVIGVGMTKFEKPGKKKWDYPQMGKEAGDKALLDAGIDYKEVQQAVIGYVYGDSTSGQRALYEIGITGIPVVNVNNNCSTGSTALYSAKQLIEGGIADCVLALGFEKMEAGSLGIKFQDRSNPLELHMKTMNEARGFDKAPFAPQMFGNAGKEHMEKYGTTQEQFAKIAYKNHKHSVNNPYSQFRDEYSLETILKSPPVFGPLTKLQCCPTSDGAAAAVVASEDFVIRHNLQGKAVEIVAMAMATDLPSSFAEKSCIKMVGFDMSKKAADEVYKKSGFSPKDVQVIELHDCFSCNELITYEALGLCPVGDGGKLIDKGEVTYGGKWVVNPSGGLISKGHPLGATGLAQCAELYWQLRGMAGNRQVKNCNLALQHNIGLGGAAIVAIYKLGWPEFAKPFVGDYNPAIHPEDPRKASSSSESAPKPAAPSQKAEIKFPANLKSSAIFEQLSKRIASEPALLKVGGVFQFNIKDSTGSIHKIVVDLKNGNGAVKLGEEKADCTITLTDDDFVKVFTGGVNPQTAFVKGLLKIQGNMSYATKLSQLIVKPKL
eukprot:TRINITY_DN10625_c0_g1_i4.p1 TRINITY_DN10625_c0_g1~~TRINITY_DN10625_c0_g1_i4.p1  ORF type:complete len:620 (-),score=155.36 TRINITY_DN10625_c0_g1_i4:60-1721(-)